MTRQVTYIASPTARKFHASNKVVRGFLGPVGNGKSVAAINELHRMAVLQDPNSEGVRKTKIAIVRNTYDMLETTTLATFRQWVPEQICRVTMKPMRGLIKYPLIDGTVVESQVIFLALDRPDDVKKLLSLEISFCFINEAKELPYEVVKAARERIGRYPSEIDGYKDVDGYKAPRAKDGSYQPCTRKALIMDTNPPDDAHWWYQLAEEGCLRVNNTEQAKRDVAEIFDFFHGVSPLIIDGDFYKPNPKAENITHLPGGYKYYLDMVAGNSREHINVMVLGNYGTLMSGKPIYPEYNDVVHCPQEEMGIIKDLPVGIGIDFGLNPSFVFGQLTSIGQLRVFAELTTDDMSVKQFARDVVKPFVETNLKGFKIAFAYGDPSGNYRGEGEGKTAIGILNDMFLDFDGDITNPLDMPFETEPAPTNDPTRRIDAVKTFMIKMVGSAEPGYLLSKRCKMLRKAKLGGYCFKLVSAVHNKYKEKPDKNIYSHISDAEQYLCLGFLDGAHKTQQFSYESQTQQNTNEYW